MMISRDRLTANLSTDAETRRALIERVLASRAFAKSERLSSLLAYVCEMSLAGRAGEINEQRIGEAVFGRSKDYDSAIDGIVRTQASRLRQKLDSYFSEEGAAEPVRILIPRGGYVPIFEARAAQPVEPPPSFGEPPVSPDRAAVAETSELNASKAKPVPTRLGAILPWAMVVALTVVIIGILIAPARLAGKHPAPKDPLWSQLFATAQSTLVVCADSGLVMWQGIRGRSIDLADYLSGDYRRASNANATPVEAWAAQLANSRYTSIVDLEITQALGPLAREEKGSMEVHYSRDLRPNDLKQGNMILLGAAEANPWVELFERNMNFVFYNNRDTRTFSVINRTPRPGEPRAWNSEMSDTQHRVYGVVAFLPNLSGNGNALLLEGTSMAGTECAWDFVSDKTQLLPFLDRIRRSDGTLPHFEVVLGTNNMSGSAVKNSILSWRLVG